MKFRSRPPDDIDINVTSLIDVVLLLLIFFMVSTRFVDQSKIDLTLPSASKEAPEKLPEVIEISIDRRGQFYVRGKALVNGKVETILQALREARGKLSDPTVVINADRTSDFQLAVDAMDAARQAGLFRITFPMNVREQE